ncbi:MAG: hypothetical protein IJM81_07955, partial [Prevotella sp.]|nr:hypothetical protein [Prevotella sp.]
PIGISSLGVNFTANNLWMITAYKGLNPETPGAVYPMSRSFSFGIKIISMILETTLVSWDIV